MSVGYTCPGHSDLGLVCVGHAGPCRKQGEPREPVRNTAKAPRPDSKRTQRRKARGA